MPQLRSKLGKPEEMLLEAIGDQILQNLVLRLQLTDCNRHTVNLSKAFAVKTLGHNWRFFNPKKLRTLSSRELDFYCAVL